MAKATETNEQLAMRVSWVSIIGNVILTAFKLFAGFVANSPAMVSDAVHSASDICGTVIVMVGVKMSNKASDKEHPYGHERFECVSAIVLAAILCVIGIGIGFGGLKRILGGNYGALIIPGALALIAAIASITVKEAMYWYVKLAAKKINSTALMAEAWHHRSDAFSSIGSFAGIFGARMGFPVLDSVACLIISVLIVKAAFDIFMDAIGKMTDRSCSDEVVAEIRGVIMAHEGVVRIDQLKTRLFGDKMYVDVEISADGDASLRESHEVAHTIHNAIESGFPNVKHCMVHVNPTGVHETPETQDMQETK